MKKLLDVQNSTTIQDALGNRASSYTGTIDPETGLPEGQGDFVYCTSSSNSTDGSNNSNSSNNSTTTSTNSMMIASYSGQWSKGAWHGMGSCRMTNGDVYVGSHVYGERHGTDCSYTWNHGERVYRGSFHHNQRHGMGVYIWNKRNVEAQEHLKPSDRSSTTTDNTTATTSSTSWIPKSKFTGQFVQGQRQGHGTFETETMDYTGEWNAGKYHGYGVLTHYHLSNETAKSSKASSNPFQQERNDGDSTTATTDTTDTTDATDTATFHKERQACRIYRGHFHSGKKHGYGIESNPIDGTVRHDGVWNQDQPVRVVNNSTTDAIGRSTSSTNGSTGDASSFPTRSTPLFSTMNKNNSNNSNNNTTTSTASTTSTTNTSADTTTSCHVVNGISCLDASGQVGMYRGLLHSKTKLPQGVGTMTYNNNNTTNNKTTATAATTPSKKEYEGFWEFGRYHGFGRLSYTNGDWYQGNFEWGLRHGPNGTYQWRDGRTYTGPWEQDVRHGPNGIFVYPNHDMYEGSFEHGKRHGYGKFVYSSDGSMYQGSWQNGMYHGYGELVLATEQKLYKGHFQNGLYHGQGMEIDTSKTTATTTNDDDDKDESNIIYKGEWIQGMPKVEYDQQQQQQEQKEKELELQEKQEQEVQQKKSASAKQEEKTITTRTKQRQFLQVLDYSSKKEDTVLPHDNDSDNDHDNGKEQELQQQQQQQQQPLDFSFSKITNVFSNLLSSSNNTSKTNRTEPVPTVPVSSSTAIFSMQPKPQSQQQQQSTASKKKEQPDPCKAVVDVPVVDGQGNAGNYTGILHITSNHPHGVGRMVYNDQNRIHEGFWQHGHRTGHGRCVFLQMGDFHEGEYEQNVRHGYGVYKWKDGRCYNGMYQQDQRCGIGTFSYPNGDVYHGSFDQGQRNGIGSFTFHQQTCKYYGQWKNGLYHGQGILQWIVPRNIDQEQDDDNNKNDDNRNDPQWFVRKQFNGQFENGVFHGIGQEYIGTIELTQGQLQLGDVSPLLSSQQTSNATMTTTTATKNQTPTTGSSNTTSSSGNTTDMGTKPLFVPPNPNEYRLLRDGIWDNGNFIREIKKATTESSQEKELPVHTSNIEKGNAKCHDNDDDDDGTNNNDCSINDSTSENNNYNSGSHVDEAQHDQNNQKMICNVTDRPKLKPRNSKDDLDIMSKATSISNRGTTTTTTATTTTPLKRLPTITQRSSSAPTTTETDLDRNPTECPTNQKLRNYQQEREEWRSISSEFFNVDKDKGMIPSELKICAEETEQQN